jgi:hypothetical protein
VVVTVSLLTSPSRGPAIDVFNFDGGRCRSTDDTSEGGRHRYLLHLQCWLLSDFSQHPQRASHRRLGKLGTCRQYFSGNAYQGGTAVNTTTASKTSFEGKNLGSYTVKNLGIVTSQKIKSKNCGPVLFIEKKTNRQEKTTNRVGPMRLRARVRTARL